MKQSVLRRVAPAAWLTALVAVAAVGRPAGADDMSAGDEFSDCESCPLMVVLPAGEFTMGAPDDEAGRAEGEGPRHRVRIAEPFAVGKFEVTYQEWSRCAFAGWCEICFPGGICDGYLPNDQGWGVGRQPVMQVSWEDAFAYVAWLSDRTGHAYRLLSEAEWEYAARAGTDSAYATGGTITQDQANFDGERAVPVGSFQANGFGLHDMHGKVAEWVGDCWTDSHEGALADGSARPGEGCVERVVKGGGWVSTADALRSASRERRWADDRWDSGVGFRVARELD